MPARFSQRANIPRHLDRHPKVRSTTQRRAGKCFPSSGAYFSSSMRRICGRYPYAATARRPAGLSYPLSRHKLGAASPAVAGRATTMRSKVCTRSLASCTLAPDTTTLKGSPCPGRWGWGQWHPSQTRLAHGAIGRPPCLLHAVGTARMRGKTLHCAQRWKVRWIALSSPCSRGKRFSIGNRYAARR